MLTYLKVEALYTNNFFVLDLYYKIYTFSVEDPGELTIKNCKHEVSEGDNVTCVCSTQQEGNPPPVISWVGQTKSSTLHLYEVTGEHSKTYTCEMIWGNQTKTVSHDLLVNGKLSVFYRPATIPDDDDDDDDDTPRSHSHSHVCA